jgi:hypothetical protein
MSERKSEAPAWSFPVAVADVPETGRRVDIAADGATREAIAKTAGLAALPILSASFDLSRLGAEGLRLAGRVRATVVQNCVVTLEPIESTVDEAVDLVFVPDAPVVPDPDGLQAVDAEDPPETLQNGTVDLGAVATEFLFLGIDPYPRKPGAVFDAPPADVPSNRPFAALAVLKKSDGPKNG